MTDSDEYGNEPLRSMKFGIFLDQFTDYKLLEDYAPWYHLVS